MTDFTGILLAAGAGIRAGGPKALLRMPDGTPWVARGVDFLIDSGCSNVIVIVGAQHRAVRALVPEHAVVVLAPHWQTGMSASLAAGLNAATGDAALVSLVDLPNLPSSVGKRVLAASGELRQAVFGGRPGHPVLIAHEHWSAVCESISGDRGARDYLVEHAVTEVECGDLSDGEDIDEV